MCPGLPLGAAPLRRLTAGQHRRAVREIFGVGTVAAALPADDLEDGFEGRAVTQTVGVTAARAYAEAADEIADAATANLPRLIGCDPAAAGEATCAGQAIATLGRRTFRRPLLETERGALMALFEAGRGAGDFREGIAAVVRALVQAPQFLYRPELGSGPGSGGRVPLSNHEIATRMAFLLWASTPDDQLLAAADRGELQTPAGVRAQAARMMSDARAREGIVDFFRQWLDLDRVLTVEKDATDFPELTPALRASMAEEPRRVIDNVFFAGDATLNSLLVRPMTFVDATLAPFYGVAAPASGWARVDLNPMQRVGLLTQPWFLASRASAKDSSPTLRGLFIRERLLCQPIPPEPPGIEPSTIPPDPTRTTRERLAETLTNPACAGCHTLIDPPGFPFEAYDALGRFRTIDSGKPVDTSVTIIGAGPLDGPVAGAQELVQKLGRSAETAACVNRRWFEHALGRRSEDRDDCWLRALANFGDMRTLLVNLMTSDAFLSRTTDGLAAAVTPATIAAPAPLPLRKAILDFLREQLTSLSRRFVAEDRMRLDVHLDALRQLERELAP